MITETAILQLKNRAEIAAQKASTYKQQQEAEQLENICNSIIDYYNRTEHLQQQVNNLHAVIQVLAEYIGISSIDEPMLHTIDATYLRHRLHIRMFADGYANATSRTLWHFVLTDWYLFCSLKESITQSEQILSDYIRSYIRKYEEDDTNPYLTTYLNFDKQYQSDIEELKLMLYQLQH